MATWSPVGGFGNDPRHGLNQRFEPRRRPRAVIDPGEVEDAEIIQDALPPADRKEEGRA